jgi:outer membrane murein-binding lipoprotein Lpp
MKRKKTSPSTIKRLSHNTMPASVGLVKEVRNELKSDISSLEHKVDSLEKRMDSKFEQVIAMSHRTLTLMEEQRGENRIVLDGLQTLNERQDRMEIDLAELRAEVRLFTSHA